MANAAASEKSASTDVDIYETLRELALPVAERNEVVSFDDLVDDSTIAEIPNPYRVVKNKDELIDQPLYIREAVFKSEDYSDYSRPYVILYAVAKDLGMVIITDGGTGIYNTMVGLVEKRIAEGSSMPAQGFFFPNGLRKSEYAIDENGKGIDRADKTTKPAGKGVTHYFA